ncbi:MAG: hypothetical protein NT077_03810, partial [Candidatus Taylorbacteria bacterium]|nr:hypothetical protein [Candidatus Taylorbacteria bacterium]
MRQILKTLGTLVVLAIIGFAAYSYSQPVRVYVDNTIYQIRSLYEPPCSKPLSYSLGSFDTRFGISKDYFLGALAEAESIWEKPLGREFFTYEPDTGRMKINLIYDYRQEASNKMQSLGLTVENNKETYDMLGQKYDALKVQYAQAKTAYDAAVKVFTDDSKAYQDKVSYWNQHGGAPRKEFDGLQAEQAVLQRELASIKIQEAQINEMVSQINSLVVVINQLANSLNLTVKKYNTVGASLGESFEEGLYHTDGSYKQIDIYEFKNRLSLVRVLAHELGHALDLDHV